MRIVPSRSTHLFQVIGLSIAVAGLTACKSSQKQPSGLPPAGSTKTAEGASDEPAAKEPGAAKEGEDGKGTSDETAAAPAGRVVELTTSMGTIKIELEREKAPKTTANFLQYVQDKHYDGTVFHRVIDNFMIQGGGFDAELNEKQTRAPIENEANNGLKNLKGTVAMARTSAPHSASAQFFINVKDNGFLDHTSETASGWGYTVFGKVTSGMDVVEKIKATKTGPQGRFPKDVPQTPIVIQSARVSDG